MAAIDFNALDPITKNSLIQQFIAQMPTLPPAIDNKTTTTTSQGKHETKDFPKKGRVLGQSLEDPIDIKRFEFRNNLFKDTSDPSNTVVVKGPRILGLSTERKIPVSNRTELKVLGKEELSKTTWVEHYNPRCKDDDVSNVVGYARVSTKEQGLHGISIELQIQKITNMCKSKTYNLLCICIDSGVSGVKNRKNRPGLDYMLHVLQDGDKIMYTDISRIWRNFTEAMIMERDLIQRHITNYVLDNNIDTATPQGRFTLYMYYLMAHYQREAQNQKIKEALELKEKKGELMHRPCYGFKRGETPRSPHIEIPEERKAIEIIRKMVTDNPKIKLADLVRFLEDPANNIPPHNKKWNLTPKLGHKWNHRALSRLLEREEIRAPINISKEKKQLVNMMKLDKRYKCSEEKRKLIETERKLLLEEINRLRTEHPSISCGAIAMELHKEEVKLESGRKISDYLIRSVLVHSGEAVSAKDPDKEMKAASIIRQFIQQDLLITIAEIIRRLTGAMEPLGRAAVWNYYTVNKLINKYKLR